MKELNTKNKWRWFGIFALVIFLFLCLGSCIWFYNFDSPSLERGSRKAQPLIDAIQLYYQKTGAYPINLQALAPEYFQTIPKPDWRHEYEYGLGPNREAFALAFVPQGTFDGYYVFCSRFGEWQWAGSGGWQYCIHTLDDFDR